VKKAIYSKGIQLTILAVFKRLLYHRYACLRDVVGGFEARNVLWAVVGSVRTISLRDSASAGARTVIGSMY
jgi:hypothetical protein